PGKCRMGQYSVGRTGSGAIRMNATSRGSHRRFIHPALAACLLAGAAGCRSGWEGRTLTSIGQIRRLAPGDARRGYPVRVRGVVLYAGGTARQVFLHDRTGEIGVDLPESVSLSAGQEVEVRGFTASPETGPSFLGLSVGVLGTGQLPPGRRAAPGDLLSGSLDHQWVEVHGVVHSAAILPDASLQMEVAEGHG